jgi:hypothetical protein
LKFNSLTKSSYADKHNNKNLKKIKVFKDDSLNSEQEKSEISSNIEIKSENDFFKDNSINESSGN